MKNFCKKVVTLMLVFAFSVSGMAVTSFAASPYDGDGWEVVSRETVVLEDGLEWVETLSRRDLPTPYDGTGYEFVQYTKEYAQKYDTSKYVKLYATFKYNEEKIDVSCIDKFTRHTLDGYKEKSLRETNSSLICTVTLNFSFEALGRVYTDSLTVGCNVAGDKI